VQQMRLTAHDATGRQAAVAVDGETYPIPATLVIKALGFDAEMLPVLFGAPDLQLSKWGTVAIDQRNFMTSLPGVFAAGDIVRGASLVVWAIRDGRDAATTMHHYIMSQAKAGEAA